MKLFKRSSKRSDPPLVGPAVSVPGTPQAKASRFSLFRRRSKPIASRAEPAPAPEDDAPVKPSALTPQKAALLTFIVFACLTAGAWKGMEYGVQEVQREPLLGRARNQPAAPPLEIDSLPLLRAAVVTPDMDQAPTELTDSVNSVFDPQSLLGKRTVEEVMVDLGIKEPAPPPPTPEEIAAEEAKKRPSLLDTYRAEVESRYTIFSVVPGHGAFLNGKWVAVRDAITSFEYAGEQVPARLAAVGRDSIAVEVEGETFRMSLAQ